MENSGQHFDEIVFCDTGVESIKEPRFLYVRSYYLKRERRWNSNGVLYQFYIERFW